MALIARVCALLDWLVTVYLTDAVPVTGTVSEVAVKAVNVHRGLPAWAIVIARLLNIKRIILLIKELNFIMVSLHRDSESNNVPGTEANIAQSQATLNTKLNLFIMV
ncbi:hypothetical protein EAW55_08280 [Legionella jordanis]|nr:hypothetical protein EAW55_08280 [Legionella jordanis]